MARRHIKTFHVCAAVVALCAARIAFAADGMLDLQAQIDAAAARGGGTVQTLPEDGLDSAQAVSLAGRWDFALGDATNFVDSIMLPSTTDIARKGDGRNGSMIVDEIDQERDDAAVSSGLTRHLTRRYGYVGPATYARDIDIPAEWAGSRVELVLERTKVVDAYIDNVHFAHSETLAAPAKLELPRWISPGRHRLRLVVDNDIKAMSARVTGHQVSEDTQTNWNGIMGRMELRSFGPISIPQIKVFPSAAENKVTAKVLFRNDGAAEAKFNVEISVSAQGQLSRNSTIAQYAAPCGVSTGEFAVALGPDAPKWSEFTPVLHTFAVKAGGVQARVRFGLRDFKAEGKRLVLNGRSVFLRGRHDACVWPLTGAAPMEVEPWRRYFRTLKDYGLNHVRFHSWCPPEAAFEAADEAGFYLQPEFAAFGGNFERDGALRRFCLEESKRIVDAYANHPSFVMFTLGNECRRGRKRRVGIVKALKAYDPRPLYSQATNGDWNSPRQCEGDDFWVTFRSCDGADGNVRGSYAHCNAPLGAVQIPGGGTMRDFSSAMRHTTIPLVGHETGQFQAYPDYSEIPKYTGVLKPVNLEIFRRRLKDAGLAGYAAEFCKASGALMAINYREEIEEALRTPGLSGFQLLDIQDFPGQGTALVGILNAFMEPKGFIAPEEWRRFCSPTVLLARFPRYTYEAGEAFGADVQVFHYGREAVLADRLEWRIEGPDGQRVASGSFDASVPAGGLTTVGKIECRLPSVADAGKFSLTLEMPGGLANSYPLWIYPVGGDAVRRGVEIVRDIESADRVLSLGGTALCILDRAKAPADSIPGFFSSDFWNWEMFNGPGRKRKAIAPGTLGLLVNAGHPALAEFPTSFHSDYQWRELLFHGVNVILDGDDKADVIVRGIDNVTRNHSLGVIWEKRCGKGRVLYCALDLESASALPEARALRRSLLDYLASNSETEEFEDVKKGAPCPGTRSVSLCEGQTLTFKSSLDGTEQPLCWYDPGSPNRVPLVVALHTWSADYRNPSSAKTVAAYCRQKGWAMIYPNFRGPNNRPEACGSDFAVHDIVDAIAWAKNARAIDENRIYIIGGSGGGHMALLMAGRHPEIFAGAVAFCPITDVARWYGESLEKHPGRGANYARMMESACGGTPAERSEEYAHRSPLTWLSRAREAGVPVYVATGIHDGWWGSVPVGHAIRAFNALCSGADAVSEEDIGFIERNQKIPESLKSEADADPFYGERMRIHLRRSSGNVRLTLFEGGHSMNFPAGLDFLGRQHKGCPADWTLPSSGKGEKEALTK